MDQLDLSRDVRARLSELSRRNGETEDRLLRRLLGLAGGGPSAPPRPGPQRRDRCPGHTGLRRRCAFGAGSGFIRWRYTGGTRTSVASLTTSSSRSVTRCCSKARRMTSSGWPPKWIWWMSPSPRPGPIAGAMRRWRWWRCWSPARASSPRVRLEH